MDSNNYEEILSIDSEPLTLVTINNDCKELIFEHLEIKDLVNIAETSKQLKTAVCAVFRRKHGNRIITYGGHDDNRYEMCVLLKLFKIVMAYFFPKLRLFPKVRPDGRCLREKERRNEEICKIKLDADELLLLKILRNFGHTLVEIELRFRFRISYRKFFDMCDIYLAKYCAKSLRKLIIVYKNEWGEMDGRPFKECKCLFEDIENPFLNVTDLTISWCILGPKLFGKLFPNLQSLTLDGNLYKSFLVTQEHLPNLKTLKICPYRKDDQGDGMEMIKLNPQLETLFLRIEEKFGTKYLQSISKYNLPMLKSLEISSEFGFNPYNFDRPFNFSGFGPFHFNNVVDFHLRLEGHANINLFTISELRHVSLSAQINFDLAQVPVLNFISRHTNLASIELYGLVSGNLDRLFNSEYILSNIVDLRILQYLFTEEMSLYKVMCSILRLLERCQSLEKLVIKGRIKYFGKTHHEFQGHLEAIRRHGIQHRLVSDEIITCKCSWCRWNFVHKCKSMELTIRKITGVSLKKYVCVFRDELNDQHSQHPDFIVIECSKTDN